MMKTMARRDERKFTLEEELGELRESDDETDKPHPTDGLRGEIIQDENSTLCQIDYVTLCQLVFYHS